MVDSIALLALCMTVLFAFSSIYSKFLIERAGSSYHFFLIHIPLALTAFWVLAVISMLNGDSFSSLQNMNHMAALIASSVFAWIGFVTLLRGFEVGNVSVGGVVLSSRVIFSVPIAIFVLSERYHNVVYLWIFIALIGAVLVSWEKGLEVRQLLLLKGGGASWFVVTCLSWAICNGFVRYLDNNVPVALFLAARMTVFALLSVATFPWLNRWLADSRNLRPTRQLTGLILIYVLVLVAAQLGMIYALGESLTITEGIGVIEGVFTFIFAVLLARSATLQKTLNEPIDKHTLIVRAVASTLAAIGAMGVLLEWGQ